MDILHDVSRHKSAKMIHDSQTRVYLAVENPHLPIDGEIRSRYGWARRTVAEDRASVRVTDRTNGDEY